MAQINPNQVGIPTVEASSVVAGVLNTVYFVAGITAVIAIVISGLLYVLSQGDASKTARAKDGILYSIVGLVVIFAAFVITNIIVGQF